MTSCNFFEGDARFEYRRFPVSRWRTEVNTDEDVIRYFEEGCHAWIAQNLEAGRNVLVHCLAGAHRAGTTGVSFMMREGRYNADTAIRLAKALRPVIDPFGSLLELLERLERAYAASGRAALSPTGRGAWAASPRKFGFCVSLTAPWRKFRAVRSRRVRWDDCRPCSTDPGRVARRRHGWRSRNPPPSSYPSPPAPLRRSAPGIARRRLEPG